MPEKRSCGFSIPERNQRTAAFMVICRSWRQRREKSGTPETYSSRPVLQPVQLGSGQVLVYGAKGEEKIYRWEGEKLILWKEEDSSGYEEKIRELEEQIICAKEQYEQLRQITMRLQEERQTYAGLYQGQKKRPPSIKDSGLLHFFNILFLREPQNVSHLCWLQVESVIMRIMSSNTDTGIIEGGGSQ